MSLGSYKKANKQKIIIIIVIIAIISNIIINRPHYIP